MSNENTNLIYIVIGKSHNFQSNWNISIYGVFDSFEMAQRVAYHATRDQRENPFLEGNLRFEPKWKGKRDGFLKYIQPKVISMQLEDWDNPVRLYLDNHSIYNFKRSK